MYKIRNLGNIKMKYIDYYGCKREIKQDNAANSF